MTRDCVQRYQLIRLALDPGIKPAWRPLGAGTPPTLIAGNLWERAQPARGRQAGMTSRAEELPPAACDPNALISYHSRQYPQSSQ